MTDPTRPRRRVLRLQGYDYASPGAYFVTIVTHERAALFGAVIDGEMRSNSAGEMVRTAWQALPMRFPGMEIGDSVVMPNHFHGIVILHGVVGAALEAARGSVLTRGRAGTSPAPTGPTLSDIIGAFKSLTTRAYTEGVQDPGRSALRRRLWQRNYYEHIIRDEADWDRIRRYIEANPRLWDEDEENPLRAGGG